MSVIEAVAKAEEQYRRFDLLTDRDKALSEVARLTAEGVSAAAIAGLIGVTERTVQRMRLKEPPKAPVNPGVPDMSEDHVRELERTADVAFDLAVRLRDEHPQFVWDALAGLDRRQLQEMTVVLLAAIPVDRFSKRELLDWVLELPAARYEP